nr:14566_t:CDS:2 [Entrophospora candida]
MPSSHLWTPSLEPRTIINSWAYKHAIINECISIGKRLPIPGKYRIKAGEDDSRDVQGAQTADDVQDDDESTGEEEEEDNEDLDVDEDEEMVQDNTHDNPSNSHNNLNNSHNNLNNSHNNDSDSDDEIHLVL